MSVVLITRGDMVKEHTSESIKNEIEKCLEAVKVKPSLKGFDRLAVAIERYCMFPEIYDGRKFYTLLYDDVAEICKTTNANVEKSIRKAIERTWTREHSELQNQLYGDLVPADKGKPTSKKFIVRTASLIHQIHNEDR